MSKVICIFSSPRSGSTWLAKILDSRPDVLYLHEPAIEDRGQDLLPFWFSGLPAEEELARARDYLQRLIALRTLRTLGARPSSARITVPPAPSSAGAPPSPRPRPCKIWAGCAIPVSGI